MSSTTKLWSYRNGLSGSGEELVGFSVEATDGHIGKVDGATADTDRYSLVVDTGFWIFGKKRLVPAGMVERIELSEEKVYVRMTKDEVKEAPEYHDDNGIVGPIDDRYESYYGQLIW